MNLRNDSQWMVVLFAVILLASCGADTHSSGGWDVGERCDACGEDDGGPDADAGGGEDAVVDSGNPQPQAVCAPRALSWTHRNVRQIPEPGLGDGCNELAHRVDENGDGEETLVRSWKRDGDTVVFEARRRGELVERIEHTFGAADTLSRVAYRQSFSPHIEGGYVDRTWTFDAEGRLTRYEAVGHPAELVARQMIKVTQRWEGDRLVEREATEYAGRVLTTHWHYAEGVLSHIDLSSSDNSLEVRVDWTYEEGLPAGVTRTVNGAKVETQSWQWAQDGELLSRSGLSDPHGYLTDPDAWRDGTHPAYPQGLDDFEAAPITFANGEPWNPWIGAGWTPRGDCEIPPHATAHGYPDFEPEYDLGFPLDERPHGIGFAYNNDTFGWQYGDMAWYGHGGIARAYGELFGLAPTSFEVTYDASGRMIGEQLEITRSRHDGPDIVEAVERERVFGARGMTRDRLELDSSELGPRVYAMEFERDARGHILERTMSLEDEVQGQQSWTWENDRLTSHDVSVLSPLGADDPDLVPTGRYIREYDAEDNLVRYADLRSNDDTAWHGTDEQRRYDGRGRLVESRHDGDTSRAAPYRHEFRYDGAHPTPVFEGIDNGQDGQFEQVTTRRLDARGRVIYEDLELSGAVRQAATYSYTCE